MIFIVIFLLIMILVLFISVSTGGYPENMTAQKLYTKIEKMESFFKQEKIQKYFENLEIPVKTLYTLDEIPDKLSYSATWFLTPRREHIGQLKLFLSELQFLTTVISDRLQKFIVIYSGSAPSNKIAFMENFYPNIRWILIDPNEHKLMYPDSKTQYDEPFCKSVVYAKASQGQENVLPLQNAIKANQSKISKSDFDNEWFDGFTKDPREFLDFWISATQKYLIIEDYMTDDLACIFKPLVDELNQKSIPCFFISDIRTSTEFGTPTDLDILWNSAQQATWCRILRPKKAMLKFRTPFWETANSVKYESSKPFYANTLNKCKNFIDFVADYDMGKYQYFTNECINIQAFAGTESVETRLITSDYDNKINYDFHDFEEKLFYYNRVYCDLLLHSDNKDCWDKELGIDGCGDCAIMCGVFKAYFAKYNLPDKTLENIRNLMLQIKRGFKKKHSYHGIFYKPYVDLNQVIDLQIRADSLMFYRSLKNKIKPTIPTYSMQKNRLVLYKKITALIENSNLPELVKQQTRIYAVHVVEVMPFFDKNMLIEMAFSMGILNIHALETAFSANTKHTDYMEIVKNIHKIIKTLNYQPMDGKVEKEKWYEPMIKTKRFRSIAFDEDKIKSFITTNKIKNIYELTNYKFLSYFTTTTIKHSLGVYYPELDGDFCIFAELNVSDNSLIIVNTLYIPEIFVYHVMQNMQKQINKPCKNIKIIIITNTRMNTLDYMGDYNKYTNKETKLLDTENRYPTSRNIVFYTYNIFEIELKSLLSNM